MLDLGLVLKRFIALVNSFIGVLPNLVVGILVFLLFFGLAGWARRSVQSLAQRSRISSNGVLLLGSLARWLVILLGGLVGLSIAVPSFEPGQLIQLLGIASIAVGFAFRDIFENFLAGVLILLTEPFQVGDQIIVGAYEGRVEDIQTRATLIRTYDNRRVVIPNAHLLTDSVTVNTADVHRRSEYDVGVSYDADVEQAKALILQALERVPGVLADPAPEALAWELADSSVNIRARWWTDSRRSNVVQVRDQVLTGVKQALDGAGVEIPFPIRTVYLHDEEDA